MVILRPQTILREQGDVIAPLRAEAADVEERNSGAEVEGNVLQAGSVDKDERPDDRRPVGIFLGLHQESLLAVALYHLVAEHRKSPKPLQVHDVLIELVEVERLAHHASHLLFHPARKISIHPVDRDKRGNGIGAASGRAISQVLVPGGIIHRQRHQDLGLCRGCIVSGFDDRVSVVKT